MAIKKESISITKSLYKLMHAHAGERDIFIYELADDMWKAYAPLMGLQVPEPPPDPHADIVAAVRKILDAEGEEASALRVLVRSLRKRR